MARAAAPRSPGPGAPGRCHGGHPRPQGAGPDRPRRRVGGDLAGTGAQRRGPLKAAQAEIIQQRERIGEFLGQVRDLEAEWTQEAIQRIATENTTLKQRVRQLTVDNRILDERLKAARSNMRFRDRRVAHLEAQLLDPPKK
jgi:hypothetical protein